MLNISTIYLESATPVYVDFFEGRLHQERLSTMGHWQGQGAKTLGLKNPVELKDLQNLLNGLTPDGRRELVADGRDPKRVAGWRVILDAAPLLNDLWAVAPREAQVRVERGFVQAVNRSLRSFEGIVTGAVTVAPKPDSQKAVMAVFRTNAAPDFTAQLQATAVLLNVAVQSPTQAQTFHASQVMALESGLRNFFEKALVAQLDLQVSHLESCASKRLKLDEMIKAMSHKVVLDAHSRDTWARRDDRPVQPAEKGQRVAAWQNNAAAIGGIAEWEEFKRIIRTPARALGRMMNGSSNGRAKNGHTAQESTDSSKQQTQSAEAKQRFTFIPKSLRQTVGHSY